MLENIPQIHIFINQNAPSKTAQETLFLSGASENARRKPFSFSAGASEKTRTKPIFIPQKHLKKTRRSVCKRRTMF